MRAPGASAVAVAWAVLATGPAGCTALSDRPATSPATTATSTSTSPAALAPSTGATHGVDPASPSSPASATTADVWVDEPPLGPVPDEQVEPATSRQAVVGYLQAAHGVGATDAAIRHRRHLPWLHPSAPARAGGHWTPDPPPPGVTRRVEILDLTRTASADHGAAWRVTYRLWDGETLHAERTRYVATRRVDDGTWRVMTETDQLHPAAH